jgi:hypothetical protein
MRRPAAGVSASAANALEQRMLKICAQVCACAPCKQAQAKWTVASVELRFESSRSELFLARIAVDDETHALLIGRVKPNPLFGISRSWQLFSLRAVKSRSFGDRGATRRSLIGQHPLAKEDSECHLPVPRLMTKVQAFPRYGPQKD